jgi:hypothetical protein
MSTPLDAQVVMGFGYASDLAKQLITLATGVLALSITFVKEFARDERTQSVKWVKLSWFMLLTSVVAGIAALSALTGALVPLGDSASGVLEIPSSARLAGGAQLLLFSGGIGMLMQYGFRVLTLQVGKPDMAPPSTPARN